jgi:hypothetical protein
MENENYTEFEKKIYAALFQNEQNEYKDKIDRINEVLSKDETSSMKLPSSEEFLIQYEKFNKGNKFNTKQVNTMNKKILMALGAAAIIGVVGFFGLSQGKKTEQANGTELKVKVSFVIGDVKVKTNLADAGSKPEVGSYLAKNQILITGEKGTADLQFSNGSSLKVKGNSEITMKTLLEKDGKITEEVTMKKGLIVANINKQKQSDNFHVITPTVIAGVRGTRFLISVNPNEKNTEDRTRVSVLDGSVGITKHRDEVAMSEEPILILDGNDSAQEMVKGGDFKKTGITESDVKIIEGKENEAEENAAVAETEESLFAKYGRLEVLSLDGGKKITGVITSMDDNTFKVHTTKGYVDVDRKKVISHDSKQLNK